MKELSARTKQRKKDVKACSMTALILPCQNINDDQRACLKRCLNKSMLFKEL